MDFNVNSQSTTYISQFNPFKKKMPKHLLNKLLTIYCSLNLTRIIKVDCKGCTNVKSSTCALSVRKRKRILGQRIAEMKAQIMRREATDGNTNTEIE